jgi:hypothetical protein
LRVDDDHPTAIEIRGISQEATDPTHQAVADQVGMCHKFPFAPRAVASMPNLSTFHDTMQSSHDFAGIRVFVRWRRTYNSAVENTGRGRGGHPSRPSPESGSVEGRVA